MSKNNFKYILIMFYASSNIIWIQISLHNKSWWKTDFKQALLTSWFLTAVSTIKAQKSTFLLKQSSCLFRQRAEPAGRSSTLSPCLLLSSFKNVPTSHPLFHATKHSYGSRLCDLPTQSIDTLLQSGRTFHPIQTNRNFFRLDLVIPSHPIKPNNLSNSLSIAWSINLPIIQSNLIKKEWKCQIYLCIIIDFERSK